MASTKNIQKGASYIVSVSVQFMKVSVQFSVPRRPREILVLVYDICICTAANEAPHLCTAYDFIGDVITRDESTEDKITWGRS